jgi:UPF0271 protein
MNINSDLGELAGHDDEILSEVDSANVCCGLHAGSASETIRTARRCRDLGVEVGAHPGFDDRENFGRTDVRLAPGEIEELIRFQVAALAAVTEIGYIKAHGALYHRCQADAEAADAIARVAKEFGVGLMGQPGFELIAAANRAGVPALREGFADRAYLPDGKLAPRSQSGSVLEPEAAAEQAIRLARSGDFETICIHGDSPGAAEVARTVRRALNEAGIRTAPLKR